MSNIRQLPPPTTDVRETIVSCVELADELDCVMIVALRRDGSQYLRSSTMDGLQKQFLAAFVAAWSAAWFNIDPEVT